VSGAEISPKYEGTTFNFTAGRAFPNREPVVTVYSEGSSDAMQFDALVFKSKAEAVSYLKQESAKN